MTPRSVVLASLLSLAMLGPACALTSKSAPIEVRYYTPEALDTTRLTASPQPASRRPSPVVRLGRVTSSGHLRNRIVVRHSPHELLTYEQERWTESPEAYLRRSLERAMFEEDRASRGYAGPAPVLDAELIGFEEVRRGTTLSGRVEIAFVLHDEQDVLASGRFAIERPAASSSMGDVVAAIGAALEAATGRIAVQVEQSMDRRSGIPR